MRAFVRCRLSYANVMSTVAVFVALGGTSYAALTITGRHVKDGSLTGADVRNASLTTSDVKNASLLARDFRAGQLPSGPAGPIGPAGPPGPPGVDGQTVGFVAYLRPDVVVHQPPTADAGEILAMPTLGGGDTPSRWLGHGDVVLRNRGDVTATVTCFISVWFSGGPGSSRSGKFDRTSVTLEPGERESVPVTAITGLMPLLMCQGEAHHLSGYKPSPIQPESAKLWAIEIK